MRVGAQRLAKRLRLALLGLAALVALLGMHGQGAAQDLSAPEPVPAEEPAAPSNLGPVPAPRPLPSSSPDACTIAILQARSLLAAGHDVDAHLLALSMSLWCQESLADWQILDAIALTHLEEHQRAHALLESLALQPGPFARRAEVLAAWVLVEGNLGNPTASKRLSAQDAARIRVYARIHSGESPGKAARLLSVDLRAAVTQRYASLQAQPHKRPWLAGTLSALVPGLGQAYAGSWQGAGMSLLLNGLFLSATVELARHELYFASATTGIAGSIFYVGNILNAVDLAQRYNEGATATDREELERILVPEAHD